MTQQERDEWEQRLRAAVAETLRRREARKQLRAQAAIARAHGLKARHQAKLNRKD